MRKLHKDDVDCHAVTPDNEGLQTSRGDARVEGFGSNGIWIALSQTLQTD